MSQNVTSQSVQGRTQRRRLNLAPSDDVEEQPEISRPKQVRKQRRKLILSSSDDEEQPLKEPRGHTTRRIQEPHIDRHFDKFGCIPTGLLKAPQQSVDIPENIKQILSVQERKFIEERHVYCLEINKRGQLLPRIGSYPIGEEFIEWGRKWIIKGSTVLNGIRLANCSNVIDLLSQ
jgi:hypothetical protein